MHHCRPINKGLMEVQTWTDKKFCSERSQISHSEWPIRASSTGRLHKLQMDAAGSITVVTVTTTLSGLSSTRIQYWWNAWGWTQFIVSSMHLYDTVTQTSQAIGSLSEEIRLPSTHYFTEILPETSYLKSFKMFNHTHFVPLKSAPYVCVRVCLTLIW